MSNAQAITWTEFVQAFRHAHIPAGIMTLKKKEFHSFRQGNRSVSEYLHKFNQLARYAPEDVATDEAKQERFLEGLNDDLSVRLIAQDYTDFQQLVNKAIRQEGKHLERSGAGFRESSWVRLLSRHPSFAVLHFLMFSQVSFYFFPTAAA